MVVKHDKALTKVMSNKASKPLRSLGSFWLGSKREQLICAFPIPPLNFELFVQKCINIAERDKSNMKSDIDKK